MNNIPMEAIRISGRSPTLLAKLLRIGWIYLIKFFKELIVANVK